MCDYMGCDFGANYIDAQCIDGRLWDLDNCDENQNLYEPTDYRPCPKCNSASYLECIKDDVESGTSWGVDNRDVWAWHVDKCRKLVGDETVDAILKGFKKIVLVLDDQNDETEFLEHVIEYE